MFFLFWQNCRLFDFLPPPSSNYSYYHKFSSKGDCHMYACASNHHFQPNWHKFEYNLTQLWITIATQSQFQFEISSNRYGVRIPGTTPEWKKKTSVDFVIKCFSNLYIFVNYFFLCCMFLVDWKKKYLNELRKKIKLHIK